MARLRVMGTTLRVALSPLERLGAFVASDPEVPLDAVSAVRVSEDPWQELRGIRSPGTGIPGVIALGARRSSAGKDFAAVYGHRPGVVVELEGAAYGRLVVSDTNAAAAAAEIEQVLARSGAGGG
jgi:hypothetical protein